MKYPYNKSCEKGKRSAARWPFFLIGISLIVLAIAGWNLVQYYNSYREEEALNDRLQHIKNEIGEYSPNEGVPEDETSQTFDETGNGAEENLSQEELAKRLREAMVAINPDYVGWLEVADTSISYPVVFRDNEYYISRDFEQKSNSHGAIFLDETCDEESLIWLIHGHHMKDGTMFAGLSEFRNVQYLEEHNSFSFDGGDGAESYRIYAAALIDFSKETELTPAFHYEKLPEDERTWQQWQNNLKKYSFWYDAKVEAQLENIVLGVAEGRVDDVPSLPEILVLSTCEYGTELQRLIVVGVKET